ncbi:hypothetical protein ACKLNQ_15110 [Myroides odoratimimus]|uniref:hypothetical protein n=1 Tax=Myroides odoratimimus TaxID=76832 RepID=UPI0038D3C92F
MEKRIFHNVIWDFSEELPETREELNQEVIAKQIRNFGNSNNWDPNEIIIDKPEVTICYSVEMYSEEDVVENEQVIKFETFSFPEDIGESDDILVAKIHLTLKADNQENFPALELLYKLHQPLLNKQFIAHLYLDGLEINEQTKNKYDYLMHFDFD